MSVAAAYGLWMGWRISSDPRIVFLLPEGGAKWIRFDEPLKLKAHDPGPVVSGFRVSFSLERAPAKAVLHLRALKGANVLVDNIVVYETRADLDKWKTLHRIDLAPHVRPGAHELRIMGYNETGPVAVLAYCDDLDLHTDETWEASKDGKTWTPAIPADGRQATQLSRTFPRADRALLGKLPFLVPVFLIVFSWGLLWDSKRGSEHWVQRLTPTPGGVRWMIVGLWVLLAANNFGKIPVHIGFDIKGHMAYVHYVAENWRVPLPTEGWTMFQAPLYYLISAPIYGLLARFLSPEGLTRALRFIPLLCGMAQVEICYRAVRSIWPERRDLQVTGTILGGLMPMNLYISQYVGNEPLAGCVVAMTVLLALRMLHDPAQARSMRAVVVLGFFLGLALLAKLTAALMILPLVLVISYGGYAASDKTGRSGARTLGMLVAVFAVACLVSGWYYLGNWIALGKPFFGGWEPLRGIHWWQDPGYRCLGQVCAFGEAFTYPFGSSLMSLWDGLYSSLWLDGHLSSIVVHSRIPPWNYGFMLSGAWLALVPSLAITAGVAVALRSARPALLFAVCCLALYFAALFHAFLTVPYYCIVKASYTLGLIPCYAALGAAGVDALGQRPIARAALYGALACWAVSAYLAYLVV